MSFLMNSACYPTSKTLQFLRHNTVCCQKTSQGLQLAVFLHCEDRVNSGIEHLAMYCVAGGPHQASYRKTSYTPATYMNMSLNAQGTV